MALAVAVAAGEDGDLAGRVHAHFAGLEQPGARAQGAGDAARRDAAGLDVGRVADAALEPLGRAGRLARLEAGDVGELDRALHRRLVVAGVVGQADRRRVGEGLDEVAPAQFGRVDAELARRGLDDALHRVGGLGPAGAAVSVDRRGVGEHRVDGAADLRRRVLAGEQRRVQDGRHRGREGAEVGTQVGGGVDAQAEELAVLVQRQFGGGQVVATMGVGEEGLRALGGPLDRPTQLLARPDQRRLLAVEEDLAAEAAADVGCDDAHLVLGNAEHEGAHQQPLDVRVLVRHVQRVLVAGRVPVRVRRARLDRVRHQPVVAEGQRRDMGGALERGVGAVLVADQPLVAAVVRRFVVHGSRCACSRWRCRSPPAAPRSRPRSGRARCAPARASRRPPMRRGHRRSAPCRRPGSDGVAPSSACRRCC